MADGTANRTSLLLHCQCADCLCYTTPHPKTGIPTKGRWFPEDQLQLHRQETQPVDFRGTFVNRQTTRFWTASGDAASSSGSSGSRCKDPGPFRDFQAPSLSLSGVKRQRSASPEARMADSLQQSSANSDSVRLTERIEFLVSRTKPPEDVFLESQPLYFDRPPHHHRGPLPDPGVFDDLMRLDPDIPSNAPFIAYLHEFSQAERFVSQHRNHPEVNIRLQIHILSDALSRYRRRCQVKLSEEWRRQYQLLHQPRLVDTKRFFRDPLRVFKPSALAAYLLVACFYLLSHASQDDCALMLAFLSIITTALTKELSDSYNTDTSATVDMPSSVDNVIKLLDITPRCKPYVCCKNCYALYLIHPNDPKGGFPDRCTQSTDNGVCNEPLRKLKKTPKGTKEAPAKEYRYRSPADYLAQLFARSDLKDYLYTNPAKTARHPDESWDVWDAPALKEFEYIDGKPFVESEDESRLVFSLNFDGFNPFGSREAGKVVKAGAIYLVCLNLPPAIRYNVENMYLVGIIPGPDGPSTHAINNLLKPLIDDFLVLWRTGLYLSRTYLRPHGIRVRGAIIPLVCDLPAARQMAGSANYMHSNFCSECKQTRSEINNLEPELWEPRTWEEHKASAEKWRQESTAEGRAQLVKADGIRWSELLRLPYWDPTKFTLIDSMHAFYLRIFQHHIRNIWGMDCEIEDGDGITFDRAKKAPNEVAMQKAHHILRHGPMAQLKTLSSPTLRELCRDTRSLGLKGSKLKLLEQLEQYRIDQGWFTADGNCIPEVHVPGAESLGTSKHRNAFPDATGQSNDARPHATGGDESTVYIDSAYDEGDEDDGVRRDEVDGIQEDSDIGNLDDQDDLEDGTDGEWSQEEGEGDDDDRPDSGTEGRLGSAQVDAEGDDMAVDSPPPAVAQGQATTGTWKACKDGSSTYDYFHSATVARVKRGLKSDLQLVFLDHVWPTLPNKPSRREILAWTNDKLASHILDARAQLGIVGGKPHPSKSPSKTRVLGRDTLKEVHSDMKTLNRPSWQGNGPPHPGEKKWGKFTADQWRIFCTVNLPVTLVRLWGNAVEGSVERRRLDNFMHLVEAVKLATKDTQTEAQILKYEYHMLQYLRSLLELYPATTVTPYQHLALHFGRHLRMFGPVHAWRCFPFERYNFLLQSIPTNNKFEFSQMEKTMFNRFQTAQHLRAIFADHDGLPDAIRPLVDVFQANYNRKFQVISRDLFLGDERWKGKEGVDWAAEDDTPIPPQVHKALEVWLQLNDSGCTDVPRKAHFQQVLYRHGRKFSTVEKHRNDSHIVYKPDPGIDAWRAAALVNILSFQRRRATGRYVMQTFAIVAPYVELEGADIEQDPYRTYEAACGRLCYNELDGTSHVIPFANITSHFASQVQNVPGIRKECILVQPSA